MDLYALTVRQTLFRSLSALTPSHTEALSCMVWAHGVLGDIVAYQSSAQWTFSSIFSQIVANTLLPIHEVSFHEAALCAAAVPLLTLSSLTDPTSPPNGDFDEPTRALLASLNTFLTTSFGEVVYITQKISYLPESTHILMTLPAITSIAQSLTALAGRGYIATRRDCPSRGIVTVLQKVCDANISDKLREAKAALGEFDEIWESRWGAVP